MRRKSDGKARVYSESEGCCVVQERTSESTSRNSDVLSQEQLRKILSDYFRLRNERIVEDITVEFFYKQHTVSALIIICALLLIPAVFISDENSDRNFVLGLIATGSFFLVVSAIEFPNGPFIRPHPVFWRIVFGCSVLYAMILQFALFHNFADIKRALKWIDPEGLSKEKLEEKSYGTDCWNVSWKTIWNYLDIFVLAHFLGWMMKALLIRHQLICWYISISWEFTEIIFSHLLPNFHECWWDAILLDILLCNGLGIYCGTKLAEYFEMRKYHWESIKDIKTPHGKLKRAVLQFTPESWIKVNWYNDAALRRILAVYAFVMVWLITELNTFFLKHIFAIDTSHPLVFWRIVLIVLISAPSIRQFYLFVTDNHVKRMGMQTWIYVAVCAFEAAICIKFGRKQFSHVNTTLICFWIIIMAIMSFAVVWICVLWAKKSSKGFEKDGDAIWYMDSSVENLGLIGDDVKARQKELKSIETGLRESHDVTVRLKGKNKDV